MRSDQLPSARFAWHLALPLLALLGIVLSSYRDVAARLWLLDEMAYAPLLAIAAMGLFVRQAKGLRLMPPNGVPWLGSALLLGGSLAYILGRSQNLELIELASIIPLVAGVLAVLGGWQALRRMAFPLFFLIFVLPYPGWVIDGLTQPLKLMISQGAEALLYLAGYPVARSGVLIRLGQYRLLVADACSGLHSLIFLSALGLLYIHFTGPRRRWQSWCLIAALVPIALLANFLRVMILLLLTYHLGNAIGQSYWHDLAGLVLFATAFAALYGLDSLLRCFSRGQPAVETALASTPAEAIGNAALRSFTVALVLLCAVGVASWLTPREYRAAQIEPFSLETLVPSAFAGWVVDDSADILVVSPEIKADLQRLYSQSLSRTYINSQGERIMLSIAYGGHQLGNELQAHRPEYCYRAQGFATLSMEETELSLAGLRLPVRRLVMRMDTRIEPVTYWMTVGDELALPGLSRKLAQIRYGLQGKIPDGMLVRVSSLGRDRDQQFALQAHFIADLQHAVPGHLGLRPAGLVGIGR